MFYESAGNYQSTRSYPFFPRCFLSQICLNYWKASPNFFFIFFKHCLHQLPSDSLLWISSWDYWSEFLYACLFKITVINMTHMFKSEACSFCTSCTEHSHEIMTVSKETNFKFFCLSLLGQTGSFTPVIHKIWHILEHLCLFILLYIIFCFIILFWFRFINSFINYSFSSFEKEIFRKNTCISTGKWCENSITKLFNICIYYSKLFNIFFYILFN